jgi:signal transduction histidine kinase
MSQFPHSARNLLKQLQEITEKLGQEVHEMAFSLRPTSLDDLGLETALSNFAEEWSKRNKIEVDYQATGLQSGVILPQVATAVFRIVQEALNNVLKHSQATRVSLILNRHATEVLVIVEDDGCGFDSEMLANYQYGERRLGLLGMKERTELVGGTFNVESSPGRGTTVFVRIPLSEDEKATIDG